MSTVIAFINSKGGVGKSTLAVNLSAAFHRDGMRTRLIDNDRNQATARRWGEMAGEGSFPVTLADGSLSQLVADLRPSYDVILIDGPGHLDKANTALVAVADILLMPVQPSALDLWACESAIEWVEQRQMITGGLPLARFVMSRCNPDERVNRNDAAQIEKTGIPAYQARTVQRVSYPRTMAVGQTVFDLPEGDKARGEISMIYKELLHDCHQLNH